MKRGPVSVLVLVIVLVLLALPVLTGCGGSATPTTAAAPTKAAAAATTASAASTTAPAAATPTKAAVAGPGVTDKEIKMGGTFPLSGAVSAAGTAGLAAQAYYNYINDQGGVNGRKINYLIEDDAYTASKTVQMIRKLVEQDKVLLTVGSLGSAMQIAVQDYLNENKVPQLFPASSSAKWSDNPQKYPWTVGFMPRYTDEGKVLGKYIVATYPNAKIGWIGTATDVSIEVLAGLKEGMGATKFAAMVQQSVDVSAVDVSSNVQILKDAGVEVLVNALAPKSQAQAFQVLGQIGWKPKLICVASSSSVAIMSAVDASIVKGAVTTVYYKDPLDPDYTNDAGMKLYKDILAKYLPSAKYEDGTNLLGMMIAWTTVRVLKDAGNDLSRDNIMKVATNMNYADHPWAQAGVAIKTTPAEPNAITSVKMATWDGRWVVSGDVIDSRK